MKVVLDIPTYAKLAGETIDLPKDEAQALIDGGHAHRVPAEPKDEPTPHMVAPKPRNTRTGLVDPADDPTPEP